MTLLKIYKHPKPIYGSKHGYLVAKFGKERLCCTPSHQRSYDLSDYSLGRIIVPAPSSWDVRAKVWRPSVDSPEFRTIIPYGWYVSKHGERYTAHAPDEFWCAIIADLSGVP